MGFFKVLFVFLCVFFFLGGGVVVGCFLGCFFFSENIRLMRV